MSSNFKLDYFKVEKVLVDWLKNRVKDAGAKGAVVGLSGGIDSSVTAVLCQKAFADNVLGVIMPCYSDKRDAEDARVLAEKFDINYLTVDLAPVLEQFLNELGDNEGISENKMAVTNIKPRLRMTTLYYYAARFNYLVVGTDNWSEREIGYFTKYGDGGIDLAPLGRLVKHEVRKLAGQLGISQSIINKAPSAGLWKGQTDENEMGVSYEVLDRYILYGEAEDGDKQKIEELKRKNAHKNETIPVPPRKLLS